MQLPFISLSRKAPPGGRRGRLKINHNEFLAAWRRSLTPTQLAYADYILHRRRHNPFYAPGPSQAEYETAYLTASRELRHNCPGPCPSPKRRFPFRR